MNSALLLLLLDLLVYRDIGPLEVIAAVVETVNGSVYLRVSGRCP